MGAGARLAEERDRWSDDWLVADLDQEAEHLLDLLERAEELRAVVPGLRVPRERADDSSTWGGAPVLVGITDRRVLVVGRWPAADADRRTSDGRVTSGQMMTAVTAVMRSDGGRGLDLPGSDAELDLDPVALDRLWSHLDGG